MLENMDRTRHEILKNVLHKSQYQKNQELIVWRTKCVCLGLFFCVSMWTQVCICKKSWVGFGCQGAVVKLSSGGGCCQFHLPCGSPSAWAEWGLWGSGQHHLPSSLLVPATLACACFFLNTHGIKISPNQRVSTLFSGCDRCCWWYRSCMSQTWVTEPPAEMQAVTCVQRTECFHIVQPLLASSNRRTTTMGLKTLDFIKCKGWGWGFGWHLC